MRISSRCGRAAAGNGIKLGAMGLKNLRFYLSGEGHVVYTLYELLFNNVDRAVLRSTGAGHLVACWNAEEALAAA